MSNGINAIKLNTVTVSVDGGHCGARWYQNVVVNVLLPEDL